MELPELLTQAGAAAFVIIVLQVLKPALGLAQETWQRFGALVSVAIGIATVNAANLAAAAPLSLVEASLTGILAGAAASGLYQAGSRTAETLRARSAAPMVEDYDPQHPDAER